MSDQKKNGWKSAFQSHRVVNAEQNPSNYHKIPHKFHIWKYICSMKWQTIQKPQNVANRKHPIFWVWICWKKKISSCDRYLIVLLLTLKWNGKQNILHMRIISFDMLNFVIILWRNLWKSFQWLLELNCPLPKCRHRIRRIFSFFCMLQQVSYQCSINQNDCNLQYTQVYLAVRRSFFLRFKTEVFCRSSTR